MIRVLVLIEVPYIVGSCPVRVKPKTIKLVFSTKYWGVRAKTGLLGIRIMCLSVAACISWILALSKFNSACWSCTKRTSSSSHWKLTCSHKWYSWKIAEFVLNNNHALTHVLILGFQLTFMMFIYCQIYWYHMILHINHLTFMYHMLFFMIFNIKIFLENGEIIQLSIWAWFHAVFIYKLFRHMYILLVVLFLIVKTGWNSQVWSTVIRWNSRVSRYACIITM